MDTNGITVIRRHPSASMMTAGALLAAGALWSSGIAGSGAAPVATTTAEGISVLHSAPVSLAEVPAQQRSAIESLGRTLGVELSVVHRAAPGVWVASSNGKTCLLSENGEGIGGSCAPNADAEAGKLGLQVRSIDGDSTENIGLVPDGVTSVTGNGASGQRVVSSEVTNNVYRVRGRALASLSLQGSKTRTLKVAG